MAPYGTWSHRGYLKEEKDPRRAHRVHEGREELSRLSELSASRGLQQRFCAREQRKVGNRTRGERKAEPLYPLAKVIWEGNEGVQPAVRDRIVWLPRLCPLPVLVELPGLALGDRLAPDVEQNLVVVQVSRKADCPEPDARPEARRAQRVAQERRGGGRREGGSEEEAVRHVESDGHQNHDQMGVGAVGGAERGYERAVEVVHEIEHGEDELGCDIKGRAGEGRQRKGRVRKGVKVRREEESEW